jgi:hypothetical protein
MATRIVNFLVRYIFESGLANRCACRNAINLCQRDERCMTQPTGGAMKINLHILLIALPLAGALTSLDAQARTSQYASASTRQVRSAVGDRYPLGARDFYYQFADSRVFTPRSDVGLALAGADGATSLDLVTQIGALAGNVPASTNAVLAPSAGMVRAGSAASDTVRENVRVGGVVPDNTPMSAPRPPMANLALPIAALGLMLFVARRRSVP